MAHGSKGHILANMRAQRLAAGLSIGDVAKKSNTSDLLVKGLEDGGNCDPHEAQRIADALGVSLATLGQGPA